MTARPAVYAHEHAIIWPAKSPPPRSKKAPGLASSGTPIVVLAGGDDVLTYLSRISRNIAMLAPLGMVVSYGRLDGPPDPDTLSAIRANSGKGPAIRFFTIHSFDDRPDIRAATMKVLLDHLAAGRIRSLIHDRLPLADAGRAQQLLESGQVIGKLLLKP